MAAANSATKDARKGARNTPGRKGRTGNQYFDVGKVGRKTGIVLKDTGVRDEHGMEPMAGIFSSPASPPKRTAGTSSSNAMELQDSSAPDVDETLNLRKTPRLPPPRASTPRHTHIGSPKRMSSARPQSRHVEEDTPDRAATQPPANRVLDFTAQQARTSADSGSPFKPKKVLRRSTDGARKSQFAGISASSPDRDSRPQVVVASESMEREAEAGADEEEQQQLDDQFANDAPMFNNDDDYYDEQREEEDAEITQALETAEQLLQTTPAEKPAAKRPRGRPRKSGESTQASIDQRTPQTAQASSRKRDRTEVEDDEANQTVQSIEQTENDLSHISATPENPAKRQRGRPRKGDITVLQDPTEGTVADIDQTIQSIEQGDNEESQTSMTAENSERRRPGRPRKSQLTELTIAPDHTEQAIDPTLLAHGDSFVAPVNDDEEVEVAPASPVTKTKKKGGRKPKAQKASQTKRAPKERDPNQSMRRTPSASPGKKSRDREQALALSPSKRTGAVSNVNLRASTPFEDAHQRMSRSGRPIMKPLKHWAGESYVWKNGEVEGIIRADEVKTPKAGNKKKTKTRRHAPRVGGRGAKHDLVDIAEESDTESTVPDDWEEQVGVIAGTVAAWDPDAQQGNPEDPIREDIAFAASSILTRDVAGSAFQYAKIMTLPFFGSGIVELPPEGFKRAKNSRKMQMVFFVHDGKVLVTVGPPAVEQNGRGGTPETNEFAISKGGVWVVPRGNNYSIQNESRTKNARIFFAQGCEVEPEMASQSQ